MCHVMHIKCTYFTLLFQVRIHIQASHKLWGGGCYKTGGGASQVLASLRGGTKCFEVVLTQGNYVLAMQNKSPRGERGGRVNYAKMDWE